MTNGSSTSSPLVMAIDVGGSSTKASVFDLGGNVCAVGRESYEPVTSAPGTVEYDAFAILDATTLAVATAAKQVDATQIASVSVDAMMSGAVPVDDDGRPVGPYTTTLDTRFGNHLTRVLDSCGERIRLLTGSGQPTLGPKIAWLMDDHPDVADRTAKYTLASGLVVGHLAGLDAQDAVVDITHIWTTGLADVTSGTWDDQLCRKQGIDPAQLPRLCRPTDVVGAITPRIAALTGLRAGTPVTAGCGDQPAGYVGSGAGELGRGADSAGTYSVFAGVTAAFSPVHADVSPDIVAHGTGSSYNCQVMVIGGGMTRQWSSALFGSLSPADLEAAAVESGPGARGARFVPHLGGLAYPPRPHLRGAWLGLTWAHVPGDFYRAVLEGIAHSHLHLTSMMRTLHHDVTFEEVLVYGGGARSNLWNQIKSDVLGVRYISVGDAPVAGLGAAMIGAQAVGLIDDASRHSLQHLAVKRVYDPDPMRHDVYMTAQDHYIADLEALSAVES